MSNRTDYDVIIIGGGISGIMAAYRLLEGCPEMKVAIFEKGHPIENRFCPSLSDKSISCKKCVPCSIMEGMAGAGAFSDGKFLITNEYGGWLSDFLGPETVIDYIEQADQILVSFGATTERYQPDDELKKLCLKHDLHMNQAQLKHIGTDGNLLTMTRIIENLNERCTIFTDTEVVDVNKENNTVSAVYKGKQRDIKGTYIIFSVGRLGSKFFLKWCKNNRIPFASNPVDIGVRVELPSLIWEDFAKKIYEPKIWYRSTQYGDITRMFCFNDRGSVVSENTDGIITVNGHSYREETKKTENSNFALLSTIKFTQPFDEPIEYARHVAKLANLISGGGILVQRLGDLKEGRRTDEKRLKQSTVRATLKAVPGDLSLCLPKRQLDNIIETIDALNRVAPGTSNYDTLLYGIECKYYSARPAANKQFEIEGCNRIYAAGDGAGFTRSLSQAAANGLCVADNIINLHK